MKPEVPVLPYTDGMPDSVKAAHPWPRYYGCELQEAKACNMNYLSGIRSKPRFTYLKDAYWIYKDKWHITRLHFI